MLPLARVELLDQRSSYPLDHSSLLRSEVFLPSSGSSFAVVLTKTLLIFVDILPRMFLDCLV